MDFEALQNKFAKKHLDERTTWILAGVDNKESLNDAYKIVYNKARQDRSTQEVMKSARIQITMSDLTGTLPTDCLQPVELYVKIGTLYIEIDRESYPYRYIRTGGVYNVIFDEKPQQSIYIEYIPKITQLSADTDEVTLPDDFEDDIINFALVEYFRNQRDWGNVSNALQYAEGKIGETISNFWLE